MQPSFRLRLLAPKYWPTWLGIGLMRLLCLLPMAVLRAMGEGLGWSVGRLLRRRRHVVLVNLRLCFPELSEPARERLADEHFKALGAGVFEAGLAWFASDARLAPHGEVVGLEHLNAAMAGGTGVLLLTGHFSTLEIGGRYMLQAGKPFHAIYRTYNNEVVTYCTRRWRDALAGLPMLPRDDVRALVRALREGRIVWYAPDQTLDPKHSVFAPFFGVPALTVTATSRLARMGRARVVPFFPERVGGRYRLHFLPALDNFPSDDEVADTTRVNRAIENAARAAPSQYFWVHRRFKRRPEGLPDVY
jgi:KDO2-lipid IV(A) lauroyltransferase